MVPAVVALDADGAPLRRAILQNDARATDELDDLRAQLHDVDFVSLTGSDLTQQSVAPTLCWLRRHEPAVYRRTRMVVGSYDWVAHRLGGELHVERNWAIESGLYSIAGEPFSRLFQAAEVEPELLPPVSEPAEVVGEVSAAAAAQTGLRPGTPIVVGGADHVLSAYGAGLLGAGDWLVKLGGAGDILVVSDTPVVDRRLYLDAHPAGGWLPNGCMATSGSLLRWLSQLTGGAPLETLDAEASATPPGAGGIVCLPYFLGEKSPLQDPRLRGAFVGLHLGHDRGHLHRAALEAVAFGFRHHVEVFGECGVKLGAARVTNGGSASALWKQILADVLDVPLRAVVGHPGASFGAALAGGVGVGAVPGWDVVGGLVKLGESFEPNEANRSLYDEHYALYRELGQTIAPVSHQLSREVLN
jgi:xylulokinase